MNIAGPATPGGITPSIFSLSFSCCSATPACLHVFSVIRKFLFSSPSFTSDSFLICTPFALARKFRFKFLCPRSYSSPFLPSRSEPSALDRDCYNFQRILKDLFDSVSISKRSDVTIIQKEKSFFFLSYVFAF